MASDVEKREAILPPEKDHPDDKLRAAASVAVQLVPIVGGSVARLAGEIFPSQAEKARNAWEEEISERTNENTAKLDQHEAILAPVKTVVGVAAEMLAALARQSPDGMSNMDYDLNDLCQLLPNASRQEVERAAFEIQNCGLASIERSIGTGWILELTPEFYETVDNQIMGWNTESDARSLACLMLEYNTGAAAELHEKSGWERRRFNPALKYLFRFFSDGDISKELQPDYPTTMVFLSPEAKAALRGFLS